MQVTPLFLTVSPCNWNSDGEWKRKSQWDIMSYPSSRFCFLLWRAWLHSAAWAWELSVAIGPSLPRKPSPGPVAWCLLPYPPLHTLSHLQNDTQGKDCVLTAFYELSVIYLLGSTMWSEHMLSCLHRLIWAERSEREKGCKHLSKCKQQ